MQYCFETPRLIDLVIVTKHIYTYLIFVLANCVSYLHRYAQFECAREIAVDDDDIIVYRLLLRTASGVFYKFFLGRGSKKYFLCSEYS